MKSNAPSRRNRKASHKRVTSADTTGSSECDNVTDVTGGGGVTTDPERETRCSPRIKVTEVDGVTNVVTATTNIPVGRDVFQEAFGSPDPDFIEGLIRQLYRAGAIKDGEEESGPNFMLSVVHGIEPQNQVEAMLAAQMAATHLATMTFAARLARVETLPQQDSAERAFNKLARTFTKQVEALKRYRTGGEQKVTVEHVTVNEGGQAIVGSVAHPGGGGDGKK